MHFSPRFRLAALILGTVSCVDQEPTSPSANALIVEAVLDAASRDQYIIVQATTGAIGRQTPVIGAVVTITTPDGRVITAEASHDSTLVATRSGEPRVTTLYHISLDGAGVPLSPGATYRLRVVVPDGREVTGSTTIPSAVPVAGPIASQAFDQSRDTLTLTWSRVVGARSYEIVVSSLRTLFSVFADTSISLNGATVNSRGGVAFLPGFTHQVVVSAVDSNYYDYYRRSSDPYTATGVTSHLQGGIGVFGSMVELETRTLIVR